MSTLYGREGWGGRLRVPRQQPRARMSHVTPPPRGAPRFFWLRLPHDFLLEIRQEVKNLGSESYSLEALEVFLPLPDSASESMDFAGALGEGASATSQANPARDVGSRRARGSLEP